MNMITVKSALVAATLAVGTLATTSIALTTPAEARWGHVWARGIHYVHVSYWAKRHYVHVSNWYHRSVWDIGHR
jgi:hypothetical protein